MNDGPQNCLKKFISFQKTPFLFFFNFLNVMKPFHHNVMIPNQNVKPIYPKQSTNEPGKKKKLTKKLRSILN